MDHGSTGTSTCESHAGADESAADDIAKVAGKTGERIGMASLRGAIAGFGGVLDDEAAAEELALVSVSGGRCEEEGGIYTLLALAVKNVWSIWKLRSCIWEIMTEGV